MAKRNSVGFAKKRSSTKKDTAPTIEIGDTGTRILSGFITEEYNPKLREQAGIKIYDEMRMSDGTVRAAFLAVTLPVRGANWYVQPASEDQADIDVAEFVEDCFKKHMTITWDDVLRQALLSLAYGSMPFEKVYKTIDVDGSARIVWDKFAPRLPRSIFRWAIGPISAGLPGITQTRSDGKSVEIPREKLVYVINEMEGMNYWGTSIFRAAYKHWYLKNNFYKIDAIAFERQGLGVPYAKLPEGATASDTTKAENILKNMRANHQAFVVYPNDYEIGFMDMNAKSVRDPDTSIAHHNREIMKSVLAQFIELGAGGSGASGSRAVSKDHSDLFMQAIETTANNIAASFNKDAVRELVDLNFNVTDYPTLTYDGITETDIAALSASYQALVTSGGIQVGVNDEQFFRNKMDLPERDPNEPPVERPGLVDPNANPDDPNANPKDKKTKDKNAMSEPWSKKKVFGISFEPWRKLTFAEQKVDFNALEKAMDKLEGEFDSATKELLHGARADYMAALTKAAHAGDTQGIKNATMKVEAEYARIIKGASKTAFEYGKTNAAKEIATQAPANPAEVLRQIDIQADAIASHHIAEIEANAKNAYVQALNKGTSITAALAAADLAAEDTIDTLTTDTTRILMAGYVNNGRDTTFDDNSDDIYALQRSELLDTHTCNYCLSIDGRIIEQSDPFAQNTIFHSGCRGIWVAILKDETELPSISGIPQSIRDRFGDDVNDLIQPKTPITKKNSAARKEAERRQQNS